MRWEFHPDQMPLILEKGRWHEGTVNGQFVSLRIAGYKAAPDGHWRAYGEIITPEPENKLTGFAFCEILGAIIELTQDGEALPFGSLPFDRETSSACI